MKLMHEKIEHFLETSKGKIPVLVCENNAFFRKLITELTEQIEGDDGDFSLYSRLGKTDELVISSHCEIIYSPFTIEVNQKQFLNKLYKSLAERAASEAFFMDTVELSAQISKYIEKLTLDFDIDIDFSTEIEFNTLLKSAGIKFAEDYENLLAKITDYLSVCQTMLKERLFVFINLHSYFNNDEFLEFLKFCTGKSIDICLIENKEYKINEYENRVVIDDDLCEI